MGTNTSHSLGSQPAAGFTFPNVGTLTYTWDSLYRRTEIDDGSSVAKWFFFGPGRVAEVKLGNDLICTHMNNARTNSAVQTDVSNPTWGGQSSDRLGYDGAGRTITKRYLDANTSSGSYSSTSAKVGFTTRYDLVSNKDYERHLHAESRSSLYPTRDSLNRLREYQRGTLSEAGDGTVSVQTAITLPSTDTERSYALDGVGNWQKTIYTPVGGGATTEVRRHNGVNQLTRFAATDVTYDHGDNTGDDARQGNGNIADDGRREYLWDALNRLVQVTDKDKTSPNDVVGVYTYDAVGRRIRKVVTNGGIPSDSGLNGTLDFLYIGVQCIEERDGSNAAQRQYIWGRYVDELIRQDELVGGSPPVYYALTDLLYRNVALTDSSKAFQEAYDTDAYGNTLIFDAAGSGSNWFADDATTTTDPKCCFIFTGRRYDPETQIYFYRARYYHPALGRFLSRDPLGYVDGLNLYEYVGGDPVGAGDPLGQAKVTPSEIEMALAVGREKLLEWARKVGPAKAQAMFQALKGVSTKARADVKWAQKRAGFRHSGGGKFAKGVALAMTTLLVLDATASDANAAEFTPEMKARYPGMEKLMTTATCYITVSYSWKTPWWASSAWLPTLPDAVKKEHTETMTWRDFYLIQAYGRYDEVLKERRGIKLVKNVRIYCYAKGCWKSDGSGSGAGGTGAGSGGTGTGRGGTGRGGTGPFGTGPRPKTSGGGVLARVRVAGVLPPIGSPSSQVRAAGKRRDRGDTNWRQDHALWTGLETSA